jgi:hypothetical protein
MLCTTSPYAFASEIDIAVKKCLEYERARLFSIPSEHDWSTGLLALYFF